MLLKRTVGHGMSLRLHKPYMDRHTRLATTHDEALGADMYRFGVGPAPRMAWRRRKSQ